MDGRIAVAVRINGAGPFRFRVDTGASRTVVSARLSTQLRLVPAGQSRTITQTGQAQRDLVRIDELSLAGADASVSSMLALVVGSHEWHAAGVLDGLLGQDVLGHWTYTIDYVAGRLLLGGSGSLPPDRAVRLTLTRASAGLIAVLPQPGADPLQLVPDSGADRLVLFGAPRPPGTAITVLEVVRVRSVTGEALARLVRIDDLRVGRIRIRNHEGLLLDAGPRDGTMGDGLLPLHLFARVTFNLAESYLLVEPRT
jgi:predicted aspartyl protease